MQLKALKSSIKRASLKDQVKDILMKQIFSGALKPGDRLKEMHIAKSLGVSQAPVREAIRSLESIGYIEHVPNVGARVKTFSIEKLMEVYQVRESLEIAAVNIAFSTGKDAPLPATRIKLLAKIFEKMKTAAAKGDTSEYAVQDTRFHRFFLEMSGNETLVEVWESLGIQFRVMHTMFGTHIGRDETIALHSGIVSEVKNWRQAAIIREISNHYKLIRKYHKNRS